MTATTECTLTVGIADLQAAISSVAPHAEKPKQGDEQPITCRVRLAAGKDHLVVSATDVRTSAVAWVKILGDSRKGKFAVTDGPFVVDLLPTHARALAASQTPIREEGEDYGEAALTLTLDEVTIVDRSGKYPGVAHTVTPLKQEATDTIPGTEDMGYPNVEAMLAKAFSRARGVQKTLLPPVGMLGRFEKAAAEYGEPLVVEPVGEADATAWLIWCGTRFAGQLNARQEDDQETRRRHSRRIDFLRRLGLLTAEDEARIALGGDDVPLDSDEDDEDGES